MTGHAWTRLPAALAIVLTAASCAGAAVNDRFTALPDICGLVEPATISAVVGDAAQANTFAPGDVGYCAWTRRDFGATSGRPFERVVSLHVTVHHGTSRSTGSETAELQQRLTADAAPGAFTEMAGIGDSAMLSSVQGQADVHFRSGNLLVWLVFSGRDMTAGQPMPILRQQAIESVILLAKEVATKLGTLAG